MSLMRMLKSILSHHHRSHWSQPAFLFKIWAWINDLRGLHISVCWEVHLSNSAFDILMHCHDKWASAFLTPLKPYSIILVHRQQKKAFPCSLYLTQTLHAAIAPYCLFVFVLSGGGLRYLPLPLSELLVTETSFFRLAIWYSTRLWSG